MAEKSNEEDMEKGSRLKPKASPEESDESISISSSSMCFSDAEEEEEQSWHSPRDSHCEGTSFSEIVGGGVPESCRCSSSSSASDCSHDDGDIGILEVKVESLKPEKDCRICQLSLEGMMPESGVPIDLGCSCKHDLGTAHKQCAETWFKIKGNKICEICGSTAKNVVVAPEIEPAAVEHWNETSSNPPPTSPTETRNFWQGHRFLNFLLACMVFAFVISWLFHFNVPG